MCELVYKDVRSWDTSTTEMRDFGGSQKSNEEDTHKTNVRTRLSWVVPRVVGIETPLFAGPSNALLFVYLIVFISFLACRTPTLSVRHAKIIFTDLKQKKT